jgi:hypothetical protein
VYKYLNGLPLSIEIAQVLLPRTKFSHGGISLRQQMVEWFSHFFAITIIYPNDLDGFSKL